MKRMFVFAVLSSASLALWGSAETDWSEKSGDVTIPAGETWYADEADMASVNALTSITVSGKIPATETTVETNAAKLVFRDCATTPKQNLLRGAGIVEKTGSDKWIMTVPQSDFTGDFILAGGIAVDTVDKSFGNTAKGVGGLFVRDGATLYVTNTAPRYLLREVHLAGAGSVACPAALYIYKARSGLMGALTFDADATVYVEDNGNYYWIGNQGNPRGDNTNTILDLGTYTYTYSGKMPLYFLGVTIHGTGTIVSRASKIVFRENGSMGTGDFVVTKDTTAQFYNRIPVIYRPLRIQDGTATFLFESNNDLFSIPETNGCWAGNVVLEKSTSKLAFGSSKRLDSQIGFSGTISGPGSLALNEGVKGRYFLSGRNTYTGTTTINGYTVGRIAAFWHDSIPDYAKTTLGTLGLLVAVPGESDGEERWPKERIYAALNEMTFADTAALGIDAEYCDDKTYELNLADLTANVTNRPYAQLSADGGTVRVNVAPGETGAIAPKAIRGTLEIGGAGTVILGGTNEVSGFKETLDGMSTVKFCDGVTVKQGPGVEMVIGRRNNDPTFGTADYQPIGRLVISNATWLSTRTANITNASIAAIRSGSIYVGSRYPGVLEIEKGGVVTNSVFVGGGNSYSSGSGGGAVYVKKGGELYLLYQGDKLHYVSRIGQAGFGYLEVNGGTLGAKSLRLGGYDGKGGALINLLGGATAYSDNHLDIAGCNNGADWTQFNILEGSSFTMKAGDFTICAGGSGTRAAINIAGTNSVLTIKGSNRTYVGSNALMRQTIFTIADGGALEFLTFYKYKHTTNYNYLASNPYPLIVNVNGGILREITYDSALFDDGPGNRADIVAIYEKGIIVDAGTRPVTQSTFSPILGLRTGGIKSVTLAEPLTGLFAPPMVEVTAGGGHGAQLVADWDSAAHTVKGIKILAPGWGYTQGAVKLRLRNSILDKTISGDAITVGDNDIGGLTVRASNASGVFTVRCATNSWAKWTRLESPATLKIGATNAIPAGTELQLYGGTLNLNNLWEEGQNPGFTGLSGTGATIRGGCVRLVGEAGNWNISAKKYLNGETTVVNGPVDLSALTTITLTDAECLTPEATEKLRSVDLFTCTSAVWPTGELTFAGVPEGYRLVRHDLSLRLTKRHGIVLFVR